MALDQLTLLINRCRRLKANNENGETILADDIRNNLDNYVCWDDVTITIEDKNGNELDSFC